VAVGFTKYLAAHAVIGSISLPPQPRGTARQRKMVLPDEIVPLHFDCG
jgi:hypothetical protein